MMPDSLAIGASAGFDQLINWAVLLVIVYLVGRFILAGISKAMGRAGWVVLVVLTLFGVISMEAWGTWIRAGVTLIHGSVIEMAKASDSDV